MSDTKIIKVGRIIGADTETFKGVVKSNMNPAFDLDNERVITSTGPDGKKVLSNVLDTTSGQYIQFKEIAGIVDADVDGEVYVKKGLDYFVNSKFNETGKVLLKNNMSSLRSISFSEINLLKKGFYEHVQLDGYYQKGDTPAPINYNLTNEAGIDDGGRLIVTAYGNLVHEFTDLDVSYFGADQSNLDSSVFKFTNTSYIISYSYNLNGGVLTIPADSVLDFKGGSINNGSIVADSTLFTGAPLFINCIIGGNTLNNKCYVDWFGVEGIEGIDDSDAIENCFKSTFAVTGFKIIEFSKIYWISRPILLPYNAKIIGRGARNNFLSGIRANTNFAPVLVDFPSRGGRPSFQQMVYGMLYHRDTTGLEMHDMTLDANYVAENCIEGIEKGYCDSYYCSFSKATIAGYLMYGAEQPKIHYCFFRYNNCAFWIGKSAINKNNLIEFSTDYSSLAPYYGHPNIVEFIGNYVIQNNYGMIADATSDINLTGTAFAHNSICAGYLGAILTNLTNVYSEGDGTCQGFLTPGGWDDGVKGVTHPDLLAQNRDGFILNSRSASDYYYNEITYYRAAFYFHQGTVNINNPFMSSKARGADTVGATQAELPTNRAVSGIDGLFISDISRTISIKGVAEYIASINSTIATKFFIITFPKFSYTNFLDFNISINNANIRGRKNEELIHTAAWSNNALDQKNNGVPVLNGDITFKNLNTFQNDKIFNSLGVITDANLEFFSQKQFVENYRGWNLFNVSSSRVFARFDYEFFKDVDYIFAEVMIKTNENINADLRIRMYDEAGVLLKTYANNTQGTITTYVEGEYRIMRIYAPTKVYGVTVKWIMVGLQASGGTNINLVSAPRIYQIGDSHRKFEIKENIYLSKGSTVQRPTVTEIGFEYFDTTISKHIWWNGTSWVIDSPTAAASANTATAPGATYDQAEMTALFDELRDMKAKIIAANLMEP